MTTHAGQWRMSLGTRRLADAPLSAADVFGRDVPRFYIRGNTTQETTIDGEYDGRVTERARWTLTFTRVG